MANNAIYVEAINQAIIEEMERDTAVFIMGEDIGAYGGAYSVTKGFIDKISAELRPELCRYHAGGDGSAGEPSGEDAIHVRRSGEASGGLPRHDVLWRWFGGASL